MIDPYNLLIQKLKNIDALTAIVKNRIYEDKVDRQPVRSPLVIIQRTDGVGTYRGLMETPLFQIRISADEPKEARDLQNIIHRELLEFSGDIDNTWVNINVLNQSFFTGDGYWNGVIDIQIKYKE